MAFNEFYVQTTGNDLNAGSTTSDSASVTSTNGDWGNAAANRFTAASGTPFSGVSVGDWASIYLDAATAAVYVAQVTAVNGGGASIDLSATAKYGTAPTTGATGRSCKIGGAMASFAGAFGPFGSGTAPANTRINIKQGSYTPAGITFGLTGSTSIMVVVRGYNTTPGDCDSDISLSIPVATFTSTNNLSISQTTHLQNLSFKSANTGQAVNISNSSQHPFWCRVLVENTSTGRAVTQAGGNIQFSQCWFKTASTTNAVVTTNNATEFHDCVFIGGLSSLTVSSNGVRLIRCHFRNSTSHLVTSSTAEFIASGCSFYNAGASSDAIQFTASRSQMAQIDNCIFESIPRYGINQASGTGVGILVTNSWYYLCTSGLSNIGDNPVLRSVVGTSSAFNNAAGNDFSPASGATTIRAGTVGTFPGETWSGQLTIGAAQPGASAGTSGGFVIGG